MLRSPYLLYTRAEIVGSNIEIFPGDPDQPQGPIVIPNRSEESGFGNWRFSPRNWFNHAYRVETKAPPSLNGRDGLAKVGEALRRRLTPGEAQPATPDGTLNDVGPLIGPDRTWLDDLPEWYSPSNFVYSYALPSPMPDSVSPMVLNYTQHGKHMIDEGFVRRYAKLDGAAIVLISYGEGNAFRQSWATNSLAGRRRTVDQVWSRSALQIFSDVSRTPGQSR